MWRFDDGQARWSSQELEVQVDLNLPSSGATDLCVADQQFADARLFAISLVGAKSHEVQPPQESYLRGDDLVATYAEVEGANIGAQLYWRVLSQRHGMAIPALELVVSAQTSLLTSDPTIQLASQLPICPVTWLVDEDRMEYQPVEGSPEVTYSATDGCSLFLFRPAGLSVSYAEFVHPSDFVSAKLAGSDVDAGRLHLTRQLIPESLEKGVIRRSRARGVFVPRAEDKMLATQCYQEFARSAPPLTT